jgi:GR25 family glycosyltransferase involved in LPS biosynthesis
MSFAKYFLPTNETEKVGLYYINLDIATERRKNMENYFGQDATRIPAISATEVQNTSYLCVSPITKQKYIQTDYGFYPTNTQKKFAEIACIFSHLEAIRRAFLDGCQFAFIMEDDIDLTILQYLTEKRNIQNGFFYSLMQQDTEITDIYQYYTNNVSQLQKNATSNDGKIWTDWNTQNWSCCIYGITRQGMQKIIDLYYLPTTLETIGGADLTRFSLDLSQFVADILIYMGGVVEFNEQLKTKTLKYPILCDVAKDSFIHPDHIGKFHIHAHNWVYLNKDNLCKMLDRYCSNLFLQC